MGFDDLFKHGRDGHHNDQGYYGGRGDDHHGQLGEHEKYLHPLDKLKANKKLLIALAVAAIIIVVVIIAVIIMFIPLIMKWLATIQHSGLKGLLETTRPLLELLWSGTGK